LQETPTLGGNKPSTVINLFKRTSHNEVYSSLNWARSPELRQEKAKNEISSKAVI
jgi:hypothetical protein